jgi:steroid 5-alpha reductase family enzyme
LTEIAFEAKLLSAIRAYQWSSYPLIAIDVSGHNPYGWLALLAPACMYWVLVHVSGIPPLEEHMLRSRGEAFRAYQKRTRPFFPLPRF